MVMVWAVNDGCPKQTVVIKRKLNNKRFMASSINTYKSVGTTGTIEAIKNLPAE